MTDFKNCRRKFYYRNELLLTPRLRKSSFSLGSAVHKGIETRSIEKALKAFDDVFPNSQEESDSIETMKIICTAMLEGYFALYPAFEDAQAEIQFLLPIINPNGRTSNSFKLAGKADGLARIDGQNWLIEYKTASVIDKNYVDKLNLDTQITTYIYALQRFLNIKIEGVIYRILRKPTIKQKQSENIFQYQDRLIKDYKDRPDWYFHEEKLYRSQDDLTEFENELWMLTQDVLHCQRNKAWFKNTGRCADYGLCSYSSLCLKQPDAMLMFEKKEQHEELEKEIDKNGTNPSDF
jgi:hypothetical protein